MMRFLLDGQLIEIDQVDPTRTLLQYLREDLSRVGTKEGCAEGDCGACTIVVAQVEGDELKFRALNSCIQFLPTLDGKALFTVESLKGVDNKLHPVQQAMVDHHGSQCGFCTPGFIMSMFALYKNHINPSREHIDDALSGNLCRCTGYRSIVDASLQMNNYAVAESSNQLLFQPAAQRFDKPCDEELELLNQLQGLRRKKGLEMNYQYRNGDPKQSRNCRYFAPTTVAELAKLYKKYPGATLLAGGTDVGLWVTKHLEELSCIIYLGNVDELKKIRVNKGNVEIGAAVLLNQAFDELSLHYGQFGEMFRRFASMPVKNAGTLG